jgi:hypothetical protein
MRSVFVVLLITGALTLAPAVAQADFPEAPGDAPGTGCEHILNQGTQVAFGALPNVDDGKAPAATQARLDAMLLDACFGGP